MYVYIVCFFPFNNKNCLFSLNAIKMRLDAFRIECQQAVETAKLSYITNLGNNVNNPGTSQKSYWKIINRVMNKCRAPKIPPLLVNTLFILNFREKHNISMTISHNSAILLSIIVYYPY